MASQDSDTVIQSGFLLIESKKVDIFTKFFGKLLLFNSSKKNISFVIGCCDIKKLKSSVMSIVFTVNNFYVEI